MNEGISIFWKIVAVLFILYIIYSLLTIKYQLKLISKHLKVRGEEKEEIEKVSNEEIEQELEDYLKR